MSKKDFEEAIDEYLRLADELDELDPKLVALKAKIAMTVPAQPSAPVRHSWTWTLGAA